MVSKEEIDRTNWVVCARDPVLVHDAVDQIGHAQLARRGMGKHTAYETKDKYFLSLC
jgi:hypothetical protein